MPEKISKRFPAQVSLEVKTFLNDKKINGELYAYFQSISYAENGRTVVYKSSLPTQTEIGRRLGCSARTYQRHRDYLLEQKYLIEDGPVYVLPNKEDVFLMIPLDTLKFLNDTLQEHVIKIYTYLGQRWKYKGDQWNFTYDELIEHLGLSLKSERTNDKIKNALLCLKKLGLIDYEDVVIRVDSNTLHKKRLTKFSLILDVTK